MFYFNIHQQAVSYCSCCFITNMVFVILSTWSKKIYDDKLSVPISEFSSCMALPNYRFATMPNYNKKERKYANNY